MAGITLPIYQNQGELDVGSNFFRPPNYTGGQAIARGADSISDGISAWAQYTAQKDDKLAQFQAESQLLDLQSRTNRQIEHNAQNITPDGKGFFQSNIDKIKSDAETTLDLIPENLRPQYEVRLKEFLNQTSDKLSSIEIAQGKSFMKDVTTRKFDALTTSVQNGLTDTATATRDLDHFIEGAQLPPNVAAALREDGLRGIESGRLEYLRTNNPVQFMQEASKYLPAAPSATAGPYQKMAIEQSLAAGLDPRLLLTMGSLESNFDPNAKASKTIYGIYQMSAAERSRLGIPENLKGDPALQTAGMIRLTKENMETLQRNGVEPTARNLWMMHFLGQAGGLTFLRANPNADAYSVYSSVAGPSIARQAFNGSNGSLLRPGMTVGQVINAITNRVSQHEAKAESFLSTDAARSADEPLVINGEKFSVLKSGDVAGYFGKAAQTVNKQIDATFDGMAKQSLLTGELNQYSQEGRKAIDKATVQSGLADAYGQNDPSARAQIDAVMKQYGYLPTPIAQRAAQKLATGTPEQRSQAYDLLYSAHATDPVRGLELSSVNPETKKRVEDYAALRGIYNMDPKEAAAYADKVNSPEFKEKLSKVDAAKIADARKSLNWAQIEKKLDLDQGFLWWRQNATPNGGAQQQIMSRYADRFEYYFRESGDSKLAQAKAISDIARSHGTTNLTPNRQFVLHPPENYYPTDASGSRKYFSEQLNSYVEHYTDDLASKAKDPALKDFDKKSVTIAGNSETANDIQAGRYPRYEVFYKDRLGDWQMIPTPFSADPARVEGKFDAGTAAGRDSKNTPGVDVAASRAERAKANEERNRAFRPRGNPTTP